MRRESLIDIPGLRKTGLHLAVPFWLPLVGLEVDSIIAGGPTHGTLRERRPVGATDGSNVYQTGIFVDDRTIRFHGHDAANQARRPSRYEVALLGTAKPLERIQIAACLADLLQQLTGENVPAADPLQVERSGRGRAGAAQATDQPAH